METCPALPPPLTPEVELSAKDFRPFDTEVLVEDAAELLECCDLDYSQNSKITVISRNQHGTSDLSDDCELDGSYTEFLETRWIKGASSEGDPDSPCKIEDENEIITELGSDTDSVVVSAPLHGPTVVRCVCVCNKKGCEFLNKPYDAHSTRESPVSRMSVRYRLVTWLGSLRPRRGPQSPIMDQVDVGAKVHPEKKFKIMRMFKSRRFRSSNTNNLEMTEINNVSTIRKEFPGLGGSKKPVLPDGLKHLKSSCQLSAPRVLAVMLGLSLVLLGVTYDHGVKHGVDNLLQGCWSWLRTSYMNFGDEFVSYNSIFFRMKNSKALYGEPYPRYGPNGTKILPQNVTSFQEAISKLDPRFLFVLEGLKLSVQLHFFSIDENSEITNSQVLVQDRGPLFFRISFRRTAGLQIDYIPSRSNMTLSTPFRVYDLMKMIILSNDLPYFGMHIHDHHKTTPSALLSMIIDNLKKFDVDIAFLSSIQKQIQKGRMKRSLKDKGKPKAKKASSTNISTKKETTREPPQNPHSSAGSVAIRGESSIHDRFNTSDIIKLFDSYRRIRRAIEEPLQKQSAWKSLEEISRKIFLPLPLDKKKTVLLPVPFLEKNLTLKYRHSVDILGLPGYQFILGNDMKEEENVGTSRPDLYPSLSYSRVKDGEKEDSATSNMHLQRHRFNNDKRKHHRHSKHQNFFENEVFRNGFNDVLGVVDLEPLLIETIGKLQLMGRHLEHYPFWVSAPHFLSITENIGSLNKSGYIQNKSWNNNSNSKISLVPPNSSLDPTTSNILVGVEGISANESHHGSFIYYHPILGVPINASLAVQVGIRPPEGMLHAHKLVPILWARAQVEEIPITLWYILWAACHLRETIMSSLIITGFLIITCALTCGRSRRRQGERRPSSA